MTSAVRQQHEETMAFARLVMGDPHGARLLVSFDHRLWSVKEQQRADSEISRLIRAGGGFQHIWTH